MPIRPSFRLAAGLCLLGVAAGSAAANPFGKGPLDHLLCCGPGAPAEHDALAAVLPGNGGDSTLPARHERRLPASRPAGATAPADPTSGVAPAARPPIIRIPGPPLSALDRPLVRQAGYAKIGFSQLAGFDFAPPPQPLAPGAAVPDVLSQVPAAIRRLDGEKVVLTGFMLPTKLEGGLATEFFFLSSSQLCCYGTMPAVNDWIVVKMAKEGLPPVQDVPVALAGKLRVRAQWTDGFLTSLYALEGDGLLKIKD